MTELIEFVDGKEKEYTELEERMLRRDTERRHYDYEQRRFEAQEAEKKRLFEIERLREESALKKEERVMKEQELEILKLKAEAGVLGADKGTEQ